MKALRFFLAALLTAAAAPCAAAPVVADISTYHIAIDADFTGMRVFLFGVRNAPGDIIIIVRGPHRSFTVRRRQRIAGIWMNGAQMTFKGVPDLYMTAATRAIYSPENQKLLNSLHIDADELIALPRLAEEKAEFPAFKKAFFAYQKKRGLYTDLPLSFMGETLFKTIIPFPDTITGGIYTVEIYLISDGDLVGMQVLPLDVKKGGFDAAVFDMAHKNPLLYGIMAISLAILAGWAASRIFDRA